MLNKFSLELFIVQILFFILAFLLIYFTVKLIRKIIKKRNLNNL